MHLITMAHLGEAQALIEEFELKKISPHHFENGQLILLITGEGPFEAASLTSYFLGKRDVKQIINLGIAGSLNDKMSIGEIYSIRSLYLAIDGKPQFKSFKLAEEGVDAITSFERILRPEKARPLSAIAQIVDREAWGVALSAKNFSIPFECAKLISDRAGEIGACELIREEAYSFSQKLSAYLKNKIEIICLNKCDVLTDEEMQEKINELQKATNKEVFPISTYTNLGVNKIVKLSLKTIKNQE